MDISKRISKDRFIEDEDTYLTGILWVSILLLADLQRLMKQENRYKGIVISYFTSIVSALKDIEFPEQELYGSILYLLKPLITLEYKKLRRRKVSKADCLIILSKKFLEIPCSIPTYPYEKKAGVALKIIGHLFDNIKNPGKNINMSSTFDAIKSFIAQGLTGKYEIQDFSIEQEENKIAENNEISGSGIKIEEDGKVIWKDE